MYIDIYILMYLAYPVYDFNHIRDLNYSDLKLYVSRKKYSFKRLQKNHEHFAELKSSCIRLQKDRVVGLGQIKVGPVNFVRNSWHEFATL